MVTVFERLEFYYKQSGKNRKLKHAQKSQLGSRIAKIYYNSPFKNLQEKLTTTTIQEDTGYFKVLQYPDEFTPILDEEIKNFCEKVFAQPRKRFIKPAYPSTYKKQ